MGNEQERLLEIGWAAGLVQGEGSFGISVSQPRRYKAKATPFFGIGMQDEEAMNRFISFCKRNELSTCISRNYSNMIYSSAQGVLRTKRYVDFFIPLLVGQKLRAAEIVEEFIRSRLSKDANASYSLEEVEMVNRARANNGGPRTKKYPAEILLENPGAGKWQLRKTHCPEGHEYSPENTYEHRGQRHCKTCKRIRSSRIPRDYMPDADL